VGPDAKVVAVAGGTGFVGGAIARELASRGQRVVVLTHRHRNLILPFVPEAIREADVTQAESLAAALAEVDTLVISLAFPNSPIEAPRHGRTFERVDAGGTEALVKAAVSAGVRRLVYMSGAGAAADATKQWFRAKWRAEEAVRGSGLTYTIFRPSWIYGPGDRSLNRFLGFARWLPFIPQIGDGQQLLAPVYIDDIGALVADALSTTAADNMTLEVGGPDSISMDDVIWLALNMMERRRYIVHAPVRLMKALTRPLTLLPSPPMTPDAIDFVVQSAQVDTAPLAKVLPRKLRSVKEGVAAYLAPRH
jgi:NADH dehydrogenase